VPLVAFVPAKVPPVAEQAVALVELQVSVEDPLPAIDVGLAVRVAAGTGVVTGTADPDPDPPQAASNDAAPAVIIGAQQRVGFLFLLSRIIPEAAWRICAVSRHPSTGSIT